MSKKNKMKTTITFEPVHAFGVCKITLEGDFSKRLSFVKEDKRIFRNIKITTSIIILENDNEIKKEGTININVFGYQAYLNSLKNGDIIYARAVVMKKTIGDKFYHGLDLHWSGPAVKKSEIEVSIENDSDYKQLPGEVAFKNQHYQGGNIVFRSISKN